MAVHVLGGKTPIPTANPLILVLLLAGLTAVQPGSARDKPSRESHQLATARWVVRSAERQQRLLEKNHAGSPAPLELVQARLKTSSAQLRLAYLELPRGPARDKKIDRLRLKTAELTLAEAEMRLRRLQSQKPRVPSEIGQAESDVQHARMRLISERGLGPYPRRRDPR